MNSFSDLSRASYTARLAAGLATVLAATAANAQQSSRIHHGSFEVSVDEYGLVSAPPSRITSIDGPEVVLGAGDVEYQAVGYDARGVRREFAAASQGDDWAARGLFTRRSFTFTDHTARAVIETNEIEITSDYSFDPLGPYLICTQTLRNKVDVPLRNILISREWLTSAVGWTFPEDLPAHAGAPTNLCRRTWMSDDLEPGATQGFTYSWRSGTPTAEVGPGNVPLAVWASPSFPSGLDFGLTNGICFTDYDADGWPDVFCNRSRRLWRNLNGADWQLAVTLPSVGVRYGASLGDYDRDGLNDIATEPRGSFFVDLFHNLGGGPNFVNVATDPLILRNPGSGPSETICWGDTDGDGWLDMFLPIYPPFAGGVGNFFYWNRGPVGPGGANAFFEQSAVGGLDNPAGAARPEGAQFVDYDFDNDLDLYSNGTLYQNKSVPGLVDFDNLPPATVGITLAGQLEEGAALCDVDLDGDFDLTLVYSASPGFRIYENRGDGTFITSTSWVIDSPLTGLDLGLSAEDWDNDGDIDITTRQVFRRNLFADTGIKRFAVATHTINSTWLTSATPAWGDFDKDGDLDCALGNWLSTGHFMRNTTYEPATPPEARRFLRVAPLLDGLPLPNGFETEYGAIVEVRTTDRNARLRRKKFTSSSNGYLNQGEYTLTFALPPDPFPTLPTQDMLFDVIVDFPGPQGAPLRRIDKFTNPALGNINYAGLADKEIRVFRSGIAIVNGAIYSPTAPVSANVFTTTQLQLPTATVPLFSPATAPPNAWVALQVDTHGLTAPQLLRDLIVDGSLADAVVTPIGTFNVALWDVTNPLAPILVYRKRLPPTAGNQRSFLPFEATLVPDRTYRVVAHLSSTRSTSVSGSYFVNGLRVDGGASYFDVDPGTGLAAAAEVLDPTAIYLALRFSP